MDSVYMILTNGFDPDIRVLKEAKYIESLNYNVEIICWDRKGLYLDKQEEQIGNIKIKRFYISSTPGTGFRQIIPFLKFIRKTRKYLKNKKYKLIHCHDMDGMIVGYISTIFRKNKNLVFDMHEIYNHYKFGKIKTIFNFLIKKSNYIIYVNDEQIKNIKNKDKLIYLPNYPIQLDYQPIQKTKSEKTRISYVGFLRDEESIETLIKFGEIHNEFLIGLYGNGTYYEKIKDNKYKNCEIHGKFNGEKEAGDIYRKTDILYCVYNPAVQNWRTCYPVKMYEGIVTNTPVIVVKDTLVGNFVEEKKIGECVTFGDLDSLYFAIEKIKNNYKQYVENIEKISNDYLWEEIRKNLNAIYKQ